MKNVEVKKTVAAEPEKKVEKAAVRPAAKETAKETETKKTEKAAEVKEVKAAKPAAKKAPAKKPAAKAAAVKTKMVFQYYGQEFDPEDIMKKVQKAAAKKADKLKKRRVSDKLGYRLINFHRKYAFFLWTRLLRKIKYTDGSESSSLFCSTLIFIVEPRPHFGQKIAFSKSRRCAAPLPGYGLPPLPC